MTNNLMKLSMLFAVWEAAKLLMGYKRLLETDVPGFKGMMVLIELCETVWCVWLLFSDFNAALILWSLIIVSFAAAAFSKEWQARVFVINCTVSLVVLTAMFMGRI